MYLFLEMLACINNSDIIVKTCLKELEGVKRIFLNNHNIEILNIFALLHETQNSIFTAR